MAYCIVTDIDLTIKELIQLADDNVPLVVTVAALDTAIAGGVMTGFSAEIQAATTKAVDNIDKAISHATTVINAYIGERYTLPFTAVPELIKTISVDIATWRLYFRKKKDKLPEAIQAAYDNSMKLLAQIRDGKINIGVTPTGSKVEPESGGMQVTAAKPIFTSDVLDRY